MIVVNHVKRLAGDATSSSTSEIGNTSLAYDGTSDNNLRYIGSNPNNYLLFNCSDYDNPSTSTCELWRIIGVINNIQTDENDLTQKESLIKIIRNDVIGSYSWDSSSFDSETNEINSGYGINEWSQADIKTELNDNYYNAQSGNCYNNSQNRTTLCDFTTTGLKNNQTRNMIQSVVWNTGTGNANNVNTFSFFASSYYDNERGDYTGKQCLSGIYCNDLIERTSKWYGKIALMYPSDYGYAVGGNTRNTCLSTELDSYDTNDCYLNDWIFKVNTNQWTITPYAYSSRANALLFVYSNGNINFAIASNISGIRPTLYLKSNIRVDSSNDDGSIEHPYKLKV